MGSILIYKGMPPLTDEQEKRLDALSQMTDEDIDYSDIPPLTDEELSKFRPARLRLKKQNIAS